MGWPIALAVGVGMGGLGGVLWFWLRGMGKAYWAVDEFQRAQYDSSRAVDELFTTQYDLHRAVDELQRAEYKSSRAVDDLFTTQYDLY